MELESKFCLSVNQCYPIKTEVPAWVVLILLGSSLFIAKNIYDIISNN